MSTIRWQKRSSSKKRWTLASAVLVGCVSAILGGCSGGSSSPTAPPAPAAAPAPPLAAVPNLVGTYSSPAAWSWTITADGVTSPEQSCAGSVTISNQSGNDWTGTFTASGCLNAAGLVNGGVDSAGNVILGFPNDSGGPFATFGCQRPTISDLEWPFIPVFGTSLPRAYTLSGTVSGGALSLAGTAYGICRGHRTFSAAVTLRASLATS
jgi:hypothetical protein